MKDIFNLNTLKYGIFAICAIFIVAGFNGFSKSVISYYYNENNFVNAKTLSDDAVLTWKDKQNKSFKLTDAERATRAEKNVRESRNKDRAEIFSNINTMASFVLFMLLIGMFFRLKTITWGRAILGTSTSAILAYQFGILCDTLIDRIIAGKVAPGLYGRAIADDMMGPAFVMKLILVTMGLIAIGACVFWIYKNAKKDEVAPKTKKPKK